MEFYADIVVPLPFDTLTYALEAKHQSIIAPGSRVIVQLGPRKYYTGLVWRIHNTRPDYKTIKPIESIVEAKACLPNQQMKLFEWMADYYMTPLGLVVKAALPSLLSNDGYILEQLEAQTLRKQTLPHAILSTELDSQEKIAITLDGLSRSRKQKQALETYLELQPNPLEPQPIPLYNIGVSRAIINQLEQKDIIKLVDIEVEPSLDPLPSPEKLPELSAEQQLSLEHIKVLFDDRDTVLFRGVTGSGKTEIYIHLITESLSREKNVLFMIPEIALTTQLLERLSKHFGNRVVAYHSRYTAQQRARLYSRLLDPSERGLLVVGVRSSIFLPLQNLDLVIVDEEHDTSYKQTDKMPGYNARDTALVMASLQKAKTLLASATPALESYYNTLSDKYGYVELDVRYQNVEMPEIVVSDTKRAAKRGERHNHINLLLKNRIAETIEGGKQVMLFQNRRGFSPYVECESCGYIPSCPDCSVSLTYHKSDSSLRCHYCGHTITLPDKCPKCNAQAISPQGFGTEKVEEVLATMYPEARIARLDADASRAQGRLARTIDNFKNHNTDILVGTQMITKGFDFGGVSLVGILNADNMLHYPDFRAGERAYQIMMQAAGRAGRRDGQGQVIIQTSEPDNQTIRAVCQGDYNTQANLQLHERNMFLYPPFSRMIRITMSARERANLWKGADVLASQLRVIFGRRTLGPEAPPLERLHGNFNVTITIKVERTRSFARARQLIKETVSKNSAMLKNIAVYYDVDPI